MSLTMTPGDGDVEQCLDVLNDLINELPYGLTVMAVALRVHLEALLQALLAGELCTREEVRAFLKDLERDALQYEESGES